MHERETFYVLSNKYTHTNILLSLFDLLTVFYSVLYCPLPLQNYLTLSWLHYNNYTQMKININCTSYMTTITSYT